MSRGFVIIRNHKLLYIYVDPKTKPSIFNATPKNIKKYQDYAKYLISKIGGRGG